MKKNKKIISLIISCILLVSLSTTANAAGEPQLYYSTITAINQAVEQYGVEQSYIDGVIELFQEVVNTNSEELNEMVLDALSSAISMKQKINSELEDVKQELAIQATTNNETHIQPASIINPTPADLARIAYLDGVALVAAADCPQTAKYMLNAMAPIPFNLVHEDDEWAQSCIYNQSFTDKIFPQFEMEILAQGKSYGTIEGSFTYTTANSSRDHHMALHNVSYTVTFALASDGNGYSVVFNISDVYDFDWTNYDNIAVGFGNNYCVAMQLLGLIQPFTISIIGRG